MAKERKGWAIVELILQIAPAIIKLFKKSNNGKSAANTSGRNNKTA